MLKFLAGLTACLICVSVGIGVGYASRNSSGTMSAINGPYTPGSVISSSIINARLADIETELTDSKSRSGKGDFTAPVRGANGTVAAPTWSFTSEPGSGLYRIGAGDIGFTLLGTKKLEVTANGFTSTNIFLAPDGTAASPGIGFTSENDGSGTGFYMGAAQSLRVASNGGEVTRFEPTKVTVNGSAGLQIGSTGSAVSASYRGTVSWTPGVIGAGGGATNTIALTGAAAGADCVVTPPGGMGLFTLVCWVTSNTCNLGIVNTSGGNQTGTSGTYACRVFNP